MPETISPLTESTLRAQIDARSWQRGHDYVRSGAVYNTRHHGTTLKADVSGTAPRPYRVEVTLGPKGIVSGDCSCPVGDGGFCKHAAAMLQLWLAKPAQFPEREDAATVLSRLGLEELRAFATRALARYPDLEDLFDTPLPTGKTRTTPVNPQMYRQRVAKAVGGGGYDRYDRYGSSPAGTNTHELHALVEEGDIYAGSGDYEAAAAAYIGIASEIMEHYEELYGWDEQGEATTVIGLCFDGLRDCLLHEVDAARREAIVETLYAMYCFDYDIPTEENVEDVLATHATAHERQLLVGWLRDRFSSAYLWRRQRAGEFILKLQAETLDDDTYIRICEEMGLIEEGVTLLLDRGRTREAIAAVKRADRKDILPVANLLVAYGESEAAERFVRERATGTSDFPLLDWLRDQIARRGDLPAALTVAEEVFRHQPGLARYQRAREIATALGRWETVRPTMIEILHPPQYRDVSILVALDEGDIDQAVTLALESLAPPVSAFPYGWANSGIISRYALTVAQAAEETRPEGARAIYERVVELLIEQKDRAAYQQACQHLMRVRGLYDAVDRFDDWITYRDGLRATYPKLRALKEEMAKAGLFD